MDYLDYKAMKDFYLVEEVCELFGVSIEVLKRAADEQKLTPSRNEHGDPGFVKHDVRKMHNKMYWDERSRPDPWQKINL